MRPLTVVGLTSDGLRLVLRAGNDTFELALRDVPTSRQPALPFADTPAPSPREIQQRIRAGESAADIADASGLPLERVVRYEGPVLAEREHQATRAQRARVDGRLVGELVAEHMTRLVQDPDNLVWDAWLTEPGRWEVRAQCGREVVRLRWDPAGVKVHAIDEAARHALRLGPASDDALGAVLRPVSGRPVRPAVVAAPAAEVVAAPAAEVVAAPAAEVVAAPAAEVVAAPAAEVVAAPAAEPRPAEPAAAETAPARPGTVDPVPARAVRAAPAPAVRAVPPRKSAKAKRAAVPAWGDITAGVAGRPPARSAEAAEPLPEQ